MSTTVEVFSEARPDSRSRLSIRELAHVALDLGRAVAGGNLPHVLRLPGLAWEKRLADTGEAVAYFDLLHGALMSADRLDQAGRREAGHGPVYEVARIETDSAGTPTGMLKTFRY